MRFLFSRSRPVFVSGLLLILLVVFWIGYGLVGHRLIEAAYKSESIAVVNKIMAGRESTPVQDYYARADQILIQTSGKALFLIAALAFLISAIKKPLEMLLACASFIIFSFLLFSLFELFPSLVEPLRLDKLGYYNAKLSKIPDETLGFRYTPGMRFIIHGNRSALYSPSYGVEVQPRTIEWVTNNDGFRGESENEVSDIVLLGDSFIEYGDSEAQSFGKKLEQQLGSRKVTNLGISGYGPFHYLEVLKRYAIKKNPKLAFFCFYEGNDIYGIQEYMNWKKDRTADLAGYELTSKSFFQRYGVLAGEIGRQIKGTLWVAGEVILRRITRAQYTHPDIVVLRLENSAIHKVLLYDKRSPLSAEEMLKTEAWQELHNILVEFTKVSIEHGITPVVLHIPMAASIYGEYSTKESGSNWRRIRDVEVTRKDNMENAMQRLSREVGIEFVNLSIPFRHKAKEGQLLYEPIDTHWNLTGREVAAQYVADQLKARGL